MNVRELNTGGVPGAAWPAAFKALLLYAVATGLLAATIAAFRLAPHDQSWRIAYVWALDAPLLVFAGSVRFRGIVDFAVGSPRQAFWPHRFLWLGISLVAVAISIFSISHEIRSVHNVAVYLNALLAQITLVPIAEEAAFRGVVQTALHRVPLLQRTLLWGITGATVTASALFALAHALSLLAGASLNSTIFEIATAFPFALLAGTIYARTGNLWSAIAIHALGNLVGF